MERLMVISNHTAASVPAPNHPLDPLSPSEISYVVKLIRDTYPSKNFGFNTITLKEPPRAAMNKWLSDKTPVTREASFVLLETGVAGLYDGYVDLTAGVVKSLEHKTNVQPIITAADLASTEEIIRKDPGVIEQCKISGIPLEDMHKVYCDPWTIGYDERFGNKRRLQQAIMYYRNDIDDFQYSHALDFCPIIDTEDKKVIYIDLPAVRRPLSKAPHPNFYPGGLGSELGYRQDLKPINITQPEGVSFTMDGNTISWQNFKMHLGFNYREGLVLSNINYFDKFEKRTRPIFRRVSLAEMIVPYGGKEHHFRKHALDVGEYGLGYMANSLGLGCDCKGSIHYLDWSYVGRDGSVQTVKNAVCIHEEDDGILYKHADFRDDFQTSLVTRARKLIISHIATVGNYTYCFYWVFHQDAVIELDIKLTGILNTYVANPGEDLDGLGTSVYPGVNAQNHQHLFSLRMEPEIDGLENSVAVVDAAPSELPVGHPENKYGNVFRPKRTVFKTSGESAQKYVNGRTWDMCNPNKLHPYSGKPASYKLVSRECAPLLPKPGSLVSKRGAFALNSMQVVPYKDGQLYPAGEYVPQTSGEPPKGITEWVGDGSANVDNTEIVVYHTFGITHFPAPEDFPIMPAEPITLLLRPRNFFLMNPALDVPPSYAIKTTEVIAKKNGETEYYDKESKLAFGNTSSSTPSCCSK